MDQLLTDLIPYNGDREVLLHWENFSTPVSNALQRMLYRFGVEETWREGICFKHLEEVKLSDLMDTPHVGELRKTQILDELSSIFGSYEANGDAFIVAPNFDSDESAFPDSIDTATNFEELIAGIIEIFSDFRTIDERTMTVLRGRVPAFL